jgi:hypothetical protein
MLINTSNRILGYTRIEAIIYAPDYINIPATHKSQYTPVRKVNSETGFQGGNWCDGRYDDGISVSDTE